MPKRLIPSISEEESFEQTLVPEQQPTQQTAYEEPQEQEYEPEVDETELEDDEEDEPVYVKSAKKQPKKGKEKPSIWTVLLVLIAIALVGILGYIGYKAYDYYHVPAYETGEISDDEEEPEETPPPAVPESEPTTTEDEPEATPKPPYSQNLIGYLTVPGVDVTEEPVLQHPTDDNFYLTHNEWDRESIWGAYYVPSEWDVSSVDDLYRVTIIFGHSNGNSLHMKFSVLKHFRDVNFAKEHRYVYFTVGGHQTRWKIFAVADYPVEPTYVIANPDDEYFLNEVANMKALSYNQYATDVGLDDKVLILSTCSGADTYETRFIVCAKLDATF